MVNNSTEFEMFRKSDNTSSVTIGEGLAITGMIIIDVLAFWGNLLNIIAILSRYHLRKNLTNLLVLNLCIIEISASIVLLPPAIVSFHYDSWTLGHFLCSFVGFFGSLLIFASISNICVISIERYYSIKFPMHHAAHMSFAKILGGILFVWIESMILSTLPLIGINSYSFQNNKKQCSFSLELEMTNTAYVITVTVLCLFVPCVILFMFYWGIFLVAHQVVQQVVPGHSSDLPSNEQRSINRNTTDMFIVSANPSQVEPCVEDISRSPPTCSRSQPHRNGRHFKAITTLMVILAAFIVCWGPYFIFQTYGSISGTVQNQYFGVMVTWLGYVTFAINPLLYGLMNRAIRAEIIEIYRHIFCCVVCTNGDSRGNEVESLHEDFLQFLERTSSGLPVAHDHRLPLVQTSPSCLCNQISPQSTGDVQPSSYNFVS